MVCLHCITTFHDVGQWNTTIIVGPGHFHSDWTLRTIICPSCYKPTIYLDHREDEVPNGALIFPRLVSRKPVDDAVPVELAADYLEACKVLSDSAKASAAISRRVVQAILEEQGYTGISRPSAVLVT
jgi:uncharacterized protein YbaR (Trm112 family)